MVPALSSCSEYQGIHFPLEPTKKWQHDATCMRFFFGNCWNVSFTQNTTADCVCILCTMIRPNMWSIRSVVRVPWVDFFTPLVSPSCSPPSVKSLACLRLHASFDYIYIYLAKLRSQRPLKGEPTFSRLHLSNPTKIKRSKLVLFGSI